MLDGDPVTHDHSTDAPGVVCCAITGIEGYQPPTPEGWARELVPFIGAGTEDDPRRPDVPGDPASWVLVYDLGSEAVIDHAGD